MPTKAIMKVNVRYGWRLLCGWLCPVVPPDEADIGWVGAGAAKGTSARAPASRFPPGEREPPVADTVWKL
jgi:hypothetical protein